MAQVGEALHRFLAADEPAYPHESGWLCDALLDGWGVTGLDPRDVVTMGDRFRDFVANTLADGILRARRPSRIGLATGRFPAASTR